MLVLNVSHIVWRLVQCPVVPLVLLLLLLLLPLLLLLVVVLLKLVQLLLRGSGSGSRHGGCRLRREHPRGQRLAGLQLQVLQALLHQALLEETLVLQKELRLYICWQLSWLQKHKLAHLILKILLMLLELLL